jgi:hypothetical protein
MIWVTSQETSGEEGTYEKPYGSISQAIECALPGQTVVLKAGDYTGDVTIQKGGTIDKPLRIVSEAGATVQCIASCWFFYDVSDVICSGITFRDSPGMALSIVGKCLRNKFELLRFVNCSVERQSACTLFFGGSGQACNTVESCSFKRSIQANSAAQAGRFSSVGIMISEGDFQEGAPNQNYIISKNNFSSYDYGVIVGSQDLTSGEYGHQIVYNSFDNCASAGVLVKCGDTLVKGNVIRNCPKHSLSISAGTGSAIEDNRIVDCGWGVRVAGKGHSISNNCIIRCGEASLGILTSISPDIESASNILVERNTIVGRSDAREKNKCAILIEPSTTCVVRENLFHDVGEPYCPILPESADNQGPALKRPPLNKGVLLSDNIVSGESTLLNGCSRADVKFQSASLDNYINDSGHGADGWMLSPEAYDPGPIISCSEASESDDADDQEKEEAEGENREILESFQTEEEPDSGMGVDISDKYLFFDDENDAASLSMLQSEYPSDDSDEEENY